jgi:hypothetical protein
LQHFNFFNNNWVDCSSVLIDEPKDPYHVNILPVNLSQDFFKSLQFDKGSLKKYRIEAAERCAQTLGKDPALCISGGVDSQCMIQAWREAKLDFKVYTLVFDNDLNIHDVTYARNFCRQKGITLTEVKINITQFLMRENFEIGMMYSSASPHFNTHYKLFNFLKSLGHSGVCCGGQTPLKNNDDWGVNMMRNGLNFINYSIVEDYPCQGSFLSFYPELAWTISLLTKSENLNLSIHKDTNNYEDFITHLRYADKINGYIRAGFDIIPQEKKYTGFELVKKYFESKTNDGWDFEKKFRFPLLREMQDMNIYPSKFNFESGVAELLTEIYIQNMPETILKRDHTTIRQSYPDLGSYYDNMTTW